MQFDLPGYQVGEKLSESTAFRVYRGHRVQDLAPVLIKVLNQNSPTPRQLAPLWQEFETLRSLDLPGVAKAYALEKDKQFWMIVMEDLGGQTIDRLNLAGCMQPGNLLSIATQMVAILDGIHTHHVIHKNISSSNIFFNPSTQQVWLANFHDASLVSKERVRLESPYKLAEFLAYTSPEATGRMNRTVDYRTDYYSLGVTLYELLTGTVPFNGDSPIELIHAHLAILPDPPNARMQPWPESPIAFEVLSAILFKLLAKNPEDRYQTCSALLADLRECQTILLGSDQAVTRKAMFVPGRFDRSTELNFPQVVIGRQEETDALLQAFGRAIHGSREIVLVSGDAGVGKTLLVNQLVRPVTEHKGMFLYTKADQARHLEVYPLLIDLLDDFCRLILSEPASSFKKWQERIQLAIAPHGQLLTDLCPQLEAIVGPQPPVEPVDRESIRPRFHQVVIRFFQAICRPDQPVVVFIDDVHWIGLDSLMLWKSILSNTSLQHILVVAAYRDKELNSEHPIDSILQSVESLQGHIVHLHLQNLSPLLTQTLVAAATSSGPAEVTELSSLVYQKTEGNPYYTVEFLTSLSKDGLLEFRPEDQKWHWDSNRIDEYGIANNVIDFFVHEIVSLDEFSQKTLQYAALIGRRFDAANLLMVFGQEKVGALALSLWWAMGEGFIYPLDEAYRALAGTRDAALSSENRTSLPSLVELLQDDIFFEFQHDRIQQAALSMLDERQLMKASLQIGWRLLEKAEQSGQETVQENLVTIVDHLNTGRGRIEDKEEALKAARLNLLASHQARASAAFVTAMRYLDIGMELLPADSWQDQYALTLELFSAAGEVALIKGDLARAESLALTAQEYALAPLEKARLVMILMDVYILQTQIDRVLEMGLSVIDSLGFDLEAVAPRPVVPERVMELPAMTDPRALAISQMDVLMMSAGYASGDPRLEKIVYFYLDLYSRFGNPPTAAYIYVTAAVILYLSKSGREQIEQGCRLGRMSLELAEKGGPSKTLYNVRYVYYAFIHHWWRSAREAIAPLYEAIQPALDAGTVWYAITMQEVTAEVSLLTGMKLEQVRSKHEEALHRVEYLNNVSFTQKLRIWAQVVLNLIGESPHPRKITGELFRKEEARALIREDINFQYLFHMHTAQAFLSFVFRRAKRALESSIAADPFSMSSRGYMVYPLHVWIFSLALLSPAQDGDLSARLEKVEEQLQMMRLWADLVPENFLHLSVLVEAEKARCLGHDEEAAKGYEQAIRVARENGHIHVTALAAELAAEFYLARQAFTAAKDHLNTAYFSYLAWGAQAKVKDLVERYPEWLPPEKETEKHALTPNTEAQPRDEITSSIDLQTILKASMELSQEINLEELLRKLMVILLENTGAQNGSLLLIENDRWFLKVRGGSNGDQGFSLETVPLEYLSPQAGKPYIPISIIHYVINLKEALVLEDASISRQFNRDSYIQTRQPRSILCAPLLSQGVLTGVIYLENNLASGVFTRDRLEIVHLLSGQAAASIEKARLYENMEEQVEERTRELSDANRRLREEIHRRNRVEEALRLSEFRYRAVFENTGTAMALIEHGFITLVNEKYAQLTGYTREELEDHFDTFNIIVPEDLARIRALQEEIRNAPSQLPYSVEFKLAQKSGTVRSVIATSTYLPGSESIIASVIDITERKSAEEALRYNEALLRKVLDILPVGVWILDKNARVIRGNPEASRIWAGVEYVEWKEFTKYKAWRPDTGERLTPETWAAFRSIAHEEITLDEELEIEAFDGTHRIILNSAIPLSTQKDGLIGAIAVNQDITGRKRNEKELQDAHDQLSSLLEISQSVVSTLDLDPLLHLIMELLGKVIPYEAAAVLIFEQDQLKFRIIQGPTVLQSLVGFPIPIQDLDLIASLLKRKEAIYLADLQDHHEIIDRIQQYLRLPASDFDYLRSWLVLPLVAKGELIGCLVLTSSERDYYSAQLQALSQAYANQVAIAIHNAQLYKQAGDHATMEERNRLARELHDSVAQALYSISLFIDATRMALNTNKTEIVENHLAELTQLAREAMSDMRLMIFELRPPILEKVGLAAALQSRLEAVEARAGFHASFHAEGTFKLSPELESELYRIAQEVLNNVLKHAQADHVSVQLMTEPDCIQLTIEDDGVGFHPEIAKTGGGQGFRNIHERAARIGAQCSFDSAPGQGTKITITIK